MDKLYRLQIRYTSEVKELIQFAADHSCMSITNFILNAAYSAAIKSIRDYKEIKELMDISKKLKNDSR